MRRTLARRFFHLTTSIAIVVLLAAGNAGSHDATFPIAGEKMSIETRNGKADRKFVFKATGDRVIRVANHDPATEGAALVIRGLGGAKDGSTGRIPLPSKFWRTVEKDGDLVGYSYKDAKGRNGGITKVALKNGKLQIKGKGKNWAWKPSGDHDLVWVLFYVEDEQYCAAFGNGAGSEVERNAKGAFKASAGITPGACPEQTCGNGVVELGEACDDGNLDDTDGCTRECVVGECVGEEYDTTYAAIQNVVFDSDVYGCTNAACHGSAKEGGLDLRAEASFEALVGVDAVATDLKRVAVNEPEASFLFEKLLAKVEGRTTVGSPMPVSAPKLSDPHLRAIRTWIRGGAPSDRVVEGTQADLGTCLPPPDPLKIPVPDPPPSGTGLQLVAPPRPLDGQSESEICMSQYYDFSSVVPEAARFPCPRIYAQRNYCFTNPSQACTDDTDCPGDFCFSRSALNEGDECFAFNRLTLLQDPQSHHSIQFTYAGQFETSDPGWGRWQYSFEDQSNPLEGQDCDPLAVDPALGYNPGCATEPRDAIACIGYGPPDFSNFLALFGVDGVAINLNVAQEPIKDVDFPDGVYEVAPMKGVMTWNSHAFNLTQGDSTLAQYLNLEFASTEDQSFPIQGLFDASSIFIQDVPAFERREYCRTWTAPKGSRLFRLSSHTHRLGTLFRVWDPPNVPCAPRCSENASFFCFGTPEDPEDPEYLPECTGPRDDEPIYFSTLYSDPEQLYFDPAIAHDEDDEAERTYLYCAVYDNGSTLTSPRVKRVSTSPFAPFASGPNELGGPCADKDRSCLAGPNKGELCDARITGVEDENAFCDTAAEAGDGLCDACPARGGVTTEDEMFVLFGDYYCPGGCEEEEP